MKDVGDERQRANRILWDQINANLLDVFDDNGSVLSLKDLKKLPEGVQRCIKKIKSTQPRKRGKGTEVIEVEFYDKQRALEILARMERWFEEDAEGSGQTVSISALIADAEYAQKISRDLQEAAKGGEHDLELPTPPEIIGNPVS